MFDRFRILPQLWRSGRLAIRLLRDRRVPVAAKVIFGAIVLYIISPLDIVPDWIPVLGQADDLVILLAGFNLFLRACPPWLVEEHEDVLDGRRDDREDGVRTDASDGPTIDGRYRRMA
jgi:uncharacterized membrane protein YkvA (DUF1232 family)